MITLAEQKVIGHWQVTLQGKKPEWIIKHIQTGKLLPVNNKSKQQHYVALYTDRFPHGNKAYVGDYICQLAPEENGEEGGIFVIGRRSFERRSTVERQQPEQEEHDRG